MNSVEQKDGDEDISNLLKTMTGKNIEFEFLIATVPDPVETKFALEFDATVEAIQRAYEARGFVLNSSWLPWPRDSHGRADPSAKTGLFHLDFPGTLLFRQVSDPAVDRFAIVCLVGESPISGVHKPAMALAFSAKEKLDKAGVKWADLGKDSPAPSNDVNSTIRIVGPYYSGSLVRLLRTSERWADDGKNSREKYKFRLVSGSATSLPTEVYPKFPRFSIQTTVVPDYLVTRAILSYLAGYRGTDLNRIDRTLDDRVAILRETNTSYGARSEPDPSRRGTAAGKKRKTGKAIR